jgi:hypothetical protein
MYLSYLTHAMILSLDAYTERKHHLWDLLQEDVNNPILDALINDRIKDVTLNLVTLNEWAIACVLIRMTDGNRRYLEIASYLDGIHAPLVFLAAKQGSVDEVCPSQPIIFESDSFAFPRCGIMGLSFDTLGKCEAMAHFGTQWMSTDAEPKWVTLEVRRSLKSPTVGHED